ncbi:MAG TPA: delta-60 repeat domain-containing protein [Gaiellaceae bacterium]|nr:delta-60 repeat domain-containing protein [Gaiellaceae bacterium]
MLKAVPLGAAAVQADGKIVTAGSCEGDFTVARYTASGGLDPGFGSGGKVMTDFGSAWGTRLASLSATRASRGVLVRWRTASEFDLRRFRLYRGQNELRRLANRGLIRAKGAGLAASYAFHDRRATHSIRRYWLREVTVDGNLRWYGPVTVRR